MWERVWKRGLSREHPLSVTSHHRGPNAAPPDRELTKGSGLMNKRLQQRGSMAVLFERFVAKGPPKTFHKPNDLWVCKKLDVYACMDGWMDACMHVCMCACAHAFCMYVCMHVCRWQSFRAWQTGSTTPTPTRYISNTKGVHVEPCLTAQQVVSNMSRKPHPPKMPLFRVQGNLHFKRSGPNAQALIQIKSSSHKSQQR